MNNRRGFTLIEMLIAVALMSVLLGLVFAYWSNLTQSRERLAISIERQQALRVLLNRLERDLATVIADGGEFGAGVEGTATRLRLCTRGVNAAAAARGEEAGLRDLQVVTIEFRQGRGLTARAESPGSATVSESTLSDRLGRVRFRYHDGRQWQDRFDSRSAGGLPTAIEVAVWYAVPATLQEEMALEGPEGGVDEEALEESMSLLDEESSLAPSGAEMDESFMAAEEELWGDPDRVRLVVVPDAPEYEFSRSYEDTGAVGGGGP